MTDGPVGANFSKNFSKGATCFPAGVCMASTWNEELLQKVGAGIAEDVLGEGRNVILGPCINIHRTPLSGRNFESFSEDPYLAARMAVPYVKGVQSRHVIACPKHFACNNFEWHRMYIDVKVDDRTLHEIYLPAFKAAVQEGGAWSIMGAYNRLNGPYCCSSKVLLTDILKNEWGFKGIAMSDWGAVHSTMDTALSGLDLEMGGTTFMATPLLEAVKKGEVAKEIVDDKVRRILRVTMLSGIFDTPWEPRNDAKELYKQPEPAGVFGKSMYGNPMHQDKALLDSPANRAIALAVAREGMVLLKNDGHVLPFDRKSIRSLAVIGPNAALAQVGGGGSAEVKPTYAVSPLEGILKRAGDKVQVRYAQGCDFDQRYNIPLLPGFCLTPPDAKPGEHGLRGEYFTNRNLEGRPVLVRKDDLIFAHWNDNPPSAELDRGNFSVRWTGKLTPPNTGKFKLYPLPHGAFYANEQGDGVRVYLDGKLIIDDWSPVRFGPKAAVVNLDASKPSDLRYEYRCAGPGRHPIAILGWIRYDEDPIKEAARVAKSCDAAVVVVGYNQYYEGENNDRGSMHLPGDQDALIQAVRKANKNTVVVLYNGSPVLMNEWLGGVPAILEAWYPGQEGGAALADILFGDVNPSGKLTVTFGKAREDYPDYANYPGDGKTVNYAEGSYVGYRHFEKKGIKPVFPFGHGLSYTSFKYSDLKIDASQGSADGAVKVELSVANTGSCEGDEVVQLYVHDVVSSLDRPLKELKSFRKVHLEAGQTKKVTMSLDKSAFSFYDPAQKQWVAEPGDFELLIGSSSTDIRLRGKQTLR